MENSQERILPIFCTFPDLRYFRTDVLIIPCFRECNVLHISEHFRKIIKMDIVQLRQKEEYSGKGEPCIG